MTTFAAHDHDTSAPDVAPIAALPRASRRDELGAVGILLGTLAMLLALALLLGGPPLVGLQ